MINIGILLDEWGISYTEKQLTRLDKLIDDFIKDQIWENFYRIGSKATNQDLSTKLNSKSFKVYCIDTKKEEITKDCDLNFEPDTENNDKIEEESFEERVIEIKDEFDPFSNLEAIESSKIPSPETPLHCEFCDFTCTLNDDIFKHHSNQHKSKPPPFFRCNFCEFVHKDRTDVELHSIKMHFRHFYCGTCEKILEATETLQSHCITSKKCKFTDTAVCIRCDMVFPNKEIKIRHREAVHRKKSISEFILSCDMCDFECSSKKGLRAKKELKDHVLQNHQNGKNKCCPHCDFKRVRLDKLKFHIDKKHPEHGHKKFNCDICKKGFIFKSSCRVHNLLSHQKKFLCEICNCVKTDKKSLEIHMAKMHKERKERNKCEICNCVKQDKKSLEIHMEKMHKEENDKNRCDICFINIPSKFKLKLHKIQKHENGGQKICLYCDTKKPEWHQLKHHIEEKHPEHGEKKHLCDVCGVGFIFEENCRAHKKIKHKENQKNVCNICGLALCNKRSLNHHMITIHKFECLEEFVCEVCGFSTFSKYSLDGHRRKHDTEKNLKCPHCDYQTQKRNSLHVHIDSKHPDHDQKKIFCSHCSMSFIFEDSLKKHMENQRTMAKNRAKKINANAKKY
jgi:hypothetical protein